MMLEMVSVHDVGLPQCSNCVDRLSINLRVAMTVMCSNTMQHIEN